MSKSIRFIAVITVAAMAIFAWFWWRPDASDVDVKPLSEVMNTRDRRQKSGIEMLKALAVSLGSSEEEFRRDVRQFLDDSEDSMTPDERQNLKDSVPRDAELRGFEVGRKACDSFAHGFNIEAACVAWEGHQELEGVRRDTIESLRTSEDVQQARNSIRLLSNYCHGIITMGEFNKTRYGGASENDTIPWFFRGLRRKVEGGELLPHRDEASRLPIFSVKDGNILRALKYCLVENISVPFPGKKYDGLRRELGAGCVPRISETSLRAVLNRIRTERDGLIEDLKKHDVFSGQVKEDYQYFEEFFRILQGRPTGTKPPLNYPPGKSVAPARQDPD
jgi:hypothetical protein